MTASLPIVYDANGHPIQVIGVMLIGADANMLTTLGGDATAANQIAEINAIDAVTAAITAGVSTALPAGANDIGKVEPLGLVAVGLSGATLSTAGQDRRPAVSTDGAMFVKNGAEEDFVDGTASNTDGTSTSVITTAGVGVKQYLKRCSLSNTHATTSVMIALKSGTTSRWRVNVPPGGRELFWEGPGLAPNAANEAWSFDPDSAVTTIECSMYARKSKV